MVRFTPGQRWISETEPELGLGTIKEADTRRVSILFPAADALRQYTIAAAPIRRVKFKPGSRVTSSEGVSFIVDSVEEKEGLLYYRGEGQELAETDLSDMTAFTSPEDRLLSGHSDSVSLFNLRYQSLICQHRTSLSEVRGFIGGRIDLIPHQFYIAEEVASRHLPRALLSDEVGLGKTIEAGLILHRLITSGTIRRVLILVPESLVHQWFVELLRRFNLSFRIFDTRFVQLSEAADLEDNLFFKDQLFIASIDALIYDMRRDIRRDTRWLEDMLNGQWDMVIADEVHHYKEESPAYTFLSALASVTPRLLLLTATPEQLSEKDHFARLRLLDSHRYHDFEAFIKETQNYHQIARIIDSFTENSGRNLPDPSILADIFPDNSDPVFRTFRQIADGKQNAADQLIADLIDRFGTGRVMFRNTRAAVSGFPKRIAHLIPCSCPVNKDFAERLTRIFIEETDGRPDKIYPDYDDDPRILWLADFLRDNPSEKILLICRSIEKVRAASHALRKKINVDSALFHEGLTLLQRDRNAAWFAEEGGARLLICSEIGSEGRNFQSTHHLVLFDLPLEPELLEQRIGRLDRIGQKHDVHIHIPYVKHSPQEVLARWYHEGFCALESTMPGGRQVLDIFGSRVKDLAVRFYQADAAAKKELSELIADSKRIRKEIAKKMEKGRNRLLEKSSFSPEKAASIIAKIKAVDSDRSIDDFMLNIFDHFGIEAEDIKDRTFKLEAGLRFHEGFPGFRDNMGITFDRETAMARQDLTFLSWDHPMVTGSMEMLLGSEKGNAALAVWPDLKGRALLLESIFVLEPVAPSGLNIYQFLPATPVRIVVDHDLNDCTGVCRPDNFFRHLENGFPRQIMESGQAAETLIPKMIATAQKTAEKQSETIRSNALLKMESELGKEISRLKALAKVNPDISPLEIKSAEAEVEDLRSAILSSRLRLDALRLIWKGPIPAA